MPPAALPDPDSQTSKGFTLNGALAFVDSRWGSEGRAELLPALEPELRRLVGGVVLSSSWYPFRFQVELYEAIDRTFGLDDRALCREIGRFTAEYELTTVHRLFMRVARLDHWLKCAGLMWRFYYSAGRLGVEAEDRGVVVHVRDFHPISTAFCLDFEGWLDRTAELTGLDDARIRHSTCLLDGAESCRYDASWS